MEAIGSDRFPLFFYLRRCARPPPLPETSVFTQITIKRNGRITLVETIVLIDKSCTRRLCISTGKSFEIISYVQLLEPVFDSSAISNIGIGFELIHNPSYINIETTDLLFHIQKFILMILYKRKKRNEICYFYRFFR